MSVYHNQSIGSRPLTDQICVATGEKKLYFFDSDADNDFKFNPSRQKSEMTIPHKATQLAWDDDKIFMCHKKGYIVYNRADGSIVGCIVFDLGTKMPRMANAMDKIGLKDAPMSVLSVYKDKMLIVSQPNKRAQFVTLAY